MSLQEREDADTAFDETAESPIDIKRECFLKPTGYAAILGS
jgi:hypothetical protein